MSDDGDSPGQVHDLTIEILKQIRDGVQATNDRLDETNRRLDLLRQDTNQRFSEVNDRLDQVNHRLDHHEEILIRHEEILIRHEQAVVKLIHEVQGLNTRMDNFLTGAHGKSHQELEERVLRIEQRLGIG